MPLTELEKQILDQADAIKEREAMDPKHRDFDAEIAAAEKYGTEQQVELLRAQQEGRTPVFGGPPVTQSGAIVPPSEVKDAATHQPVVPADETVNADEPVRESDEDVAPYDEWTKNDLQSEVDVRNARGSSLKRTGTVAELVAVLREDDAANGR